MPKPGIEVKALVAWPWKFSSMRFRSDEMGVCLDFAEASAVGMPVNQAHEKPWPTEARLSVAPTASAETAQFRHANLER
jgi:hypothetical protein